MTPADRDGLSVTLRLHNEGGTISLDTGARLPLSAADVDAMMSLLPKPAEIAAHHSPSTMTAGAQSSLAEARAAQRRRLPVVHPDPTASSLLAQLVDYSDAAAELPVTDLGPSRPLADVLSDRKSVREFGPVSGDLVGTIMARAALTRRRWRDQDGYPESTRPVPSAGARHPHLLVLVAHQVIGLAPGAWALDPDAAVLRRTNHDRSSIDHALEAVCAAMHVVDPPPAAVFTVAVPHLILDRYPAGMPLLWHDAGALLATIHLVATDLGAGSCIVGTSGVLHPNLGDPLLPVDTGVVAIGRYV